MHPPMCNKRPCTVRTNILQTEARRNRRPTVAKPEKSDGSTHYQEEGPRRLSTPDNGQYAQLQFGLIMSIFFLDRKENEATTKLLGCVYHLN